MVCHATSRIVWHTSCIAFVYRVSCISFIVPHVTDVMEISVGRIQKKLNNTCSPYELLRHSYAFISGKGVIA